MNVNTSDNPSIDYELDQGEKIGSILRGERLTMGFELEDVHERLKIRTEVIDAMENNDLESIGRPQFVAGYIRSYARLLKMDPEQVIDAYVAQCGLVRQAPTSQPKREANNGFLTHNRARRGRGASFSAISHTTTLALSLIVGFAVIGGFVYVGSRVLQGVQTLDIVPSQSRPTALTQNEMAAIDNAQFEDSSERPSINYDDLYQRQALQTPVVQPRSGRIADVDVNSVGFFASDAPVTAAPSTADENTLANDVQGPVASTSLDTVEQEPVVSVAPTVPELQLVPLGESWVRLTNEDGEVLFEQLLRPGEVVNVPIDGYVPILRRAGNASQLYVRVNGQIYGPMGADGETVVNNIPLMPDNIESAYPAVSEDIIQELQTREQSFLASNQD